MASTVVLAPTLVDPKTRVGAEVKFAIVGARVPPDSRSEPMVKVLLVELTVLSKTTEPLLNSRFPPKSVLIVLARRRVPLFSRMN